MLGYSREIAAIIYRPSSIVRNRTGWMPEVTPSSETLNGSWLVWPYIRVVNASNNVQILIQKKKTKGIIKESDESDDF
jgi:hypothetical protein